MLFSLLMPSQDRLKRHIDERIDMQVISKQLEQKTLDLKEYANFIIDIMAKLCAPARDEQVAALHGYEKPVELFKHIFEVSSVGSCLICCYLWVGRSQFENVTLKLEWHA